MCIENNQYSVEELKRYEWFYALMRIEQWEKYFKVIE